MRQIILTDKGCFDGAYGIKDIVKIEGETYYRIGRNGMDDMVVDADYSVIVWALSLGATKEKFIEDTIEELAAHGKVSEDLVMVECIFKLKK